MNHLVTAVRKSTLAKCAGFGHATAAKINPLRPGVSTALCVFLLRALSGTEFFPELLPKLIVEGPLQP